MMNVMRGKVVLRMSTCYIVSVRPDLLEYSLMGET